MAMIIRALRGPNIGRSYDTKALWFFIMLLMATQSTAERMSDTTRQTKTRIRVSAKNILKTSLPRAPTARSMPISFFLLRDGSAYEVEEQQRGEYCECDARVKEYFAESSDELASIVYIGNERRVDAQRGSGIHLLDGVDVYRGIELLFAYAGNREQQGLVNLVGVTHGSVFGIGEGVGDGAKVAFRIFGIVCNPGEIHIHRYACAGLPGVNRPVCAGITFQEERKDFGRRPFESRFVGKLRGVGVAVFRFRRIVDAVEQTVDFFVIVSVLSKHDVSYFPVRNENVVPLFLLTVLPAESMHRVAGTLLW